MDAVDLPSLVQGMSGLLQRSIGPQFEIATQFPGDLPAALTDTNQLETALLNLVVNARDAMPYGGVIRIEGSVEAVAAPSGSVPPGTYVCLSVTDEGEGMDETTLARAREPFFTTKGLGKGTGLGLSMVHGLAEQSGGRLKITSVTGQGARVEIWLPVAEKTDKRLAVPARVGRGEAQMARHLLVLAVDDDDLVLTNTTAMLEDLGHKVIAVSSAAEALAAVAVQPVDVVLTDFAMPHMTGLELSRAILANRPFLPIILTSGYAELPPGTEEQFPRLAKPYNQVDLAQALRKAALAQVSAA